MNYRIDNLQYCNWSREIFEINKEAGLDAIHVTIVYHEDYHEFLQKLEDWNKLFEKVYFSFAFFLPIIAVTIL